MTTKQMDYTGVDVMIFKAKGFRSTANDLQAGLNKIVAKHGESISVPLFGEQMMGYFCSAVILRALATELALKALSLAKRMTYRKGNDGHDLLLLFKDLDGGTKDLIAILESIHGVAPIPGILARHRKDFLDWRYLAEDRSPSTGLLALDKALAVLLNVAEHKDFRESCSLPHLSKES